MRIYNLFPTLAGPISEWIPHLQRAAAMQFDWVFVNPIHLTGRSGSLYSVKDYFQFNPQLLDKSSGMDARRQYQTLSREAEKLGLGLMVDLVVNHCASDSPLLDENPEWFVQKNGQFVHASCQEGKKRVVWKDLVQFDHKNTQDKEGLYQYIRKVVEFLADLGFRGFRCDAAYQVPEDFWDRLISDMRMRRPGLIFLAETLGCSPDLTIRTSRAGFDTIFNSSKWWDFDSPWLLEQYDLTRDYARSISFPESHDTLRLAEEMDGNIDGLKQRYLFSALYAAGVMIPVGFEFGFRNRLNVVQTRPGDWEDTGVDLTDYIRKVNQTKAENPIFNEEAPTEIIATHNPNILILWKGSNQAGQEALIILNKDIHNKQAFQTDTLYQYIQSPGPLIDVSPEYPLDYLPTPFEYDLRPGQGIVLVTEP